MSTNLTVFSLLHLIMKFRTSNSHPSPQRRHTHTCTNTTNTKRFTNEPAAIEPLKQGFDGM